MLVWVGFDLVVLWVVICVVLVSCVAGYECVGTFGGCFSGWDLLRCGFAVVVWASLPRVVVRVVVFSADVGFDDLVSCGLVG